MRVKRQVLGVLALAVVAGCGYTAALSVVDLPLVASTGVGMSDEASPPGIAGGRIAFVSFSGGVDAQSVDRAIRDLDRAVVGGHRAVLLEIDSPGGSVFAGLRLAKAIERSPIPVYCVVDGVALSMGYYLLQSCEQRIMTARSILMIHEPSISSFAQSTPGQLQDRANMLRALSRALVEHMALRMKISADELEAKIRDRDWWMEHREALQVGAIDAVVDSVGTLIVLL